MNDFSTEPYLARIRNDRPAEGLDQRRLARAIVPNDREDLAGKRSNSAWSSAVTRP